MATSKKMTSGIEELDPRELIFAPKTENSLFWNARLNIDPQQLAETRQSIQDDGLLEEMVVRKLPDGRYQVVCGERRLRCIIRLLRDNAPCFSLPTGESNVPAEEVYGKMKLKVLYNCSDKQASRLSVAENLKRKDLTEWELMEYCRELATRKLPDGSEAYSRKDICDIIARSATWVSQTVSLYELPSEVYSMLSDGTLHRTVALGLLKVKQPLVALALKRAIKLAEEDVEKAKEMISKEVGQLEKQLQDAELTVAATGAVGTNEEAHEAKKLRTATDHKLAEAKQRQQTAKSRQPRLTQDSLSRATDVVTGARRGKSTGMSHKAVRTEIKTTKNLISENKLRCDCNKQDFSQRDVELVLLGLQMVLGEVKTRNVLGALRERYVVEKRAGWHAPVSSAAAAPVEDGMDDEQAA